MTPKKILIVDDEETNIAILKSLFIGDKYEITVARDGEEGLAAAKSVMPDLILMDVMMPKMNGFKVCGLIKNESRYSQIPIMILSSRAGADDLETSKQVGADAYVVKPIDKGVVTEKMMLPSQTPPVCSVTRLIPFGTGKDGVKLLSFPKMFPVTIG